MGGDGEVDVKFFSCEHFMQVSPALKQLWGFTIVEKIRQLKRCQIFNPPV